MELRIHDGSDLPSNRDFRSIDGLVAVFNLVAQRRIDKIMAAAYLERANQVKGLTDVAQFVSSYPDVGRVPVLTHKTAGLARFNAVTNASM